MLFGIEASWQRSGWLQYFVIMSLLGSTACGGEFDSGAEESAAAVSDERQAQASWGGLRVVTAYRDCPSAPKHKYARINVYGCGRWCKGKVDVRDQGTWIKRGTWESLANG